MQTLPLRVVNEVLPGDKLVLRPAGRELDDDARVAIILSARGSEDLMVLEAKRANQPAEWTIPVRVSLVGIVFGPQGLDTKKVGSLLKSDKQLVIQLADYAEQTAQTEALIDALTAGRNAPAARNVDAAIAGFATRYGSTSRIDPNAPLEQQALVLMRGINPALSSYDPLAPEQRLRMEQSAGLAASVASLFFGSTVGLAAGGASMFLNMRTLLFPDTEFRSAFAQLATPGDDNAPLALCAKREPAKARTRTGYLWAMRLPDASAPTVSLPEASYLPAGVKSAIALSSDDWKLLERARDWQLERADAATAVPVPMKLLPQAKSIELDLSGTSLAPGVFRLTASWDWQRFTVPGEIRVLPLPGRASLAPFEGDKLVAGSGAVSLQLDAPDLEFTDKVTLRSASGSEHDLAYKLPLGKRNGPQPSLFVTVDTNSTPPGRYKLLAVQPDGRKLEVPVRLLPPNPVVGNAPVRANIGESSQLLNLQGSGLDRIQSIQAPSLDITLAPGKESQRDVTVRLSEKASKGDRIDLTVKVEGLERPLVWPGAVVVAGPRPKILSSQLSLPGDAAVSVRDGELPAGTFSSIALRVNHAEPSPQLQLQCGEARTVLLSSRPRHDIRMSDMGAGNLFLSLDPAAAGPVGCELIAVAEVSDTGRSDAFRLGRVVRLPRIDSFQLTDEKLDASVYAGILTGFDLELVEKIGWNESEGRPVRGFPAPVPGEGQKQSLKIAMPWPPPAPRAPIFVWLRGDTEGRRTTVRY